MRLHEPWLGFVVSSIGAQKVKKDTSVQPALKHMLQGETTSVMVACLLLVNTYAYNVYWLTYIGAP